MNLVVRPGGHAQICQSKRLCSVHSTHAGRVVCPSPAIGGVDRDGRGIAKGKVSAECSSRRNIIICGVLRVTEMKNSSSTLLCFHLYSGCALKASQYCALCLGFVHYSRVFC